MPAEAPSPSLRIGDWTLHPASHELEGPDGRQRLPRRLCVLLERLAREPGQVVPRETLLRDVWERQAVADEVLSRNVAELRRLLADDTREPRYIETIPKGGYRLIAAVAVVATGKAGDAPSSDPESPRSAIAADAAPAPTRNRIALIAVASAAIVALAISIAWWRPPSSPPASAVQATPAAAAQVTLARERPLTSDPGLEIGPALSPDGSLVAYASIADDDAGTTQLFVRAVDGTAQRAMTDGKDVSVAPAFSPDGTQLAFVRRVRGSCEVRVLPVLGGTARAVATCDVDHGSGIDWSPDGTRLALLAPALENHSAGIALFDLAQANLQRITTPEPGEGADRDPRFSPDGRHLSFARGEPGNQRLLLIDLQQPAVLRDLLPPGNRVSGHAWTPDGRVIVAGADQPGYRALVQIEIASGAISLVGARGAQYPAFARNGDLVFESAQYDANIWRVRLHDDAAPNVDRVAASTRYDATPSIAPDGQRFAYVSTRTDLESIWIAQLDGSGEAQLPIDTSMRWTRPAWSPDGRWLVLTGYQGNVTTIYRHELASARTQELTALGDDAYGAQFSTDGASIVYSHRDAPLSKSLWRIDAALARPAQRIATGVDQFHVGDGVVVWSQPAVSGQARAGVMVSDLDGIAPRALDLPITEDNRYDWTVRAREIWFAVRDPDGKARLKRYGIDTRQTEAMADDIVPSAINPTLSVSVDGKTILFARVDSVTTDLMFVPAAAPPL